jgi:hypothetical protein
MSGEFTITIEQARNLVQGKFTFRPCLDCRGVGTELHDEGAGVVAQHVDPSRPLDFYRYACESCKGLGGFIQWQ